MSEPTSGDASSAASRNQPAAAGANGAHDAEPKPTPKQTRAAKIATGEAKPGAAHAPAQHQAFWLWIMCLTGVDYFSTLGYQPSIAFEAAGRLAPLATVILVLVTLFGALPVYCHVASKSPHGQGSIAMLETLVHGWTGKMIVLVLLGFAATDFVITKTLSAADAVVHILHNPWWERLAPGWVQSFTEDHQRVALTMFLLVALGASFLRGFKEVIGLAVGIVAVYLVLNLVVIGSGLYQVAGDRTLLTNWWTAVESRDWHVEHDFGIQGTGLLSIAALCALIFPKLALGLSGFETGVAVMPLIRGRPNDDPHRPWGRIVSARKLLFTAAIIMSVMLLGSALVTATVIDPKALSDGGDAKDRALAYLAHGESSHPLNPLFGDIFGTIYDVSTVIILWFAGASAMAGLLNLVPQYLPRYGMAPEWARIGWPLVLVFTAINLLVTWIFNADVEAQGGAYATGVLVLMSSACLATVIDRWRTRHERHWITYLPIGFALIMLVFFFTTAMNMYERPDGLKIATFFILAVVAASFGSRVKRSTELRFSGFEFANPESRFLWDSLKHLEFPVLVPHRPGGERDIVEKDQNIRQRHRLANDVPIVFIEAVLGDPSDFHHNPLMEIHEDHGRFVIGVTGCASIAHVIATIALELSKFGKPPEIHFGWSDESTLRASANFLLFGQGNVPWMVRELIRKAEPNPSRQPDVYIG